jgi:alkylation response protein AidB-like acyl-CoA dehydrogenase
MLDFSFSKEQKMIKTEFARLVKELVIDKAHDIDESGAMDREIIQVTWEMGASISGVPEKYGGYGAKSSPTENCIILEELAYGDMAYAIQASLPSLFIQPLLLFGTPAQQDKYLPIYCSENYMACSLALNEPWFGFDANDLKTTAVKQDGHYILNGEKCFVPLAQEASHIMVAANLDGKNQLFIVEKDNEGIEIGEREKNIGLYGLQTNEVKLVECRIPMADRVGEENGCDFDRFLQGTRVGICAMAVGICRATLDFVKRYAKERHQFGEPIAHRQAIAFMIAEMAYEVDAMRLLSWKAASQLESGKDAARDAYLSKLYCGEKAMKICDFGVQILGGHGFIREYPVERYYRNSRGVSILEAVATV